MANRFFIQQYLQEEYQHGGVGGSDAEKILLGLGYKPINFPFHHSYSVVAKLSRLFFLFKTFFSTRKGSVIIFLHPVYSRMNRILVNWLSRKSGVRLVCFIADIDGLKDGDEDLLQTEIRFFKRFELFIVHNDRMESWLRKCVHGQASIATIGFFDFLVKPVERTSTPSYDIVFAGNLEKSSFLSQLHLLQKDSPSLHFHLFGVGMATTDTQQPNVTWHGVEKPYDLPAKLVGSFGLLWDGTSIDKPDGSHGRYMQYISHHKLSLYIISKLPVIAPANSAAAELILKYGIGFTVNSLHELEERVNRVTTAEYNIMQASMEPLAQIISQGKGLKKAVNDIEQDLPALYL